jgi:hypothetical protein
MRPSTQLPVLPGTGTGWSYPGPISRPDFLSFHPQFGPSATVPIREYARSGSADF